MTAEELIVYLQKKIANNPKLAKAKVYTRSETCSYSFDDYPTEIRYACFEAKKRKPIVSLISD